MFDLFETANADQSAQRARPALKTASHRINNYTAPRGYSHGSLAWSCLNLNTLPTPRTCRSSSRPSRGRRSPSRWSPPTLSTTSRQKSRTRRGKCPFHILHTPHDDRGCTAFPPTNSVSSLLANSSRTVVPSATTTSKKSLHFTSSSGETPARGMHSGFSVLKRCLVYVAESSSRRSRSLHQSITVTSKSAESATHVSHRVQPTAANAVVVTLHSSVRAYILPFSSAHGHTHVSRQQQEEVEVVHSLSCRRCMCGQTAWRYGVPKNDQSTRMPVPSFFRQRPAIYFVPHLIAYTTHVFFTCFSRIDKVLCPSTHASLSGVQAFILVASKPHRAKEPAAVVRPRCLRNAAAIAGVENLSLERQFNSRTRIHQRDSLTAKTILYRRPVAAGKPIAAQTSKRHWAPLSARITLVALQIMCNSIMSVD